MDPLNIEHSVAPATTLLPRNSMCSPRTAALHVASTRKNGVAVRACNSKSPLAIVMLDRSTTVPKMDRVLMLVSIVGDEEYMNTTRMCAPVVTLMLCMEHVVLKTVSVLFLAILKLEPDEVSTSTYKMPPTLTFCISMTVLKSNSSLLPATVDGDEDKLSADCCQESAALTLRIHVLNWLMDMVLLSVTVMGEVT